MYHENNAAAVAAADDDDNDAYDDDDDDDDAYDDDDDNDDDDDDNYELEAIVSASLRPCQSPERGAALNPCNRPTLPIHLYVLVAAKMRTLCFSRPRAVAGVPFVWARALNCG